MRRRHRRSRTFLILMVLVGAAGASALAGGCSTATLTEKGTCRGTACSCEEDPGQPLCKAFNERGDATLATPFDASRSDAFDGGDGGDAR